MSGLLAPSALAAEDIAGLKLALAAEGAVLLRAGLDGEGFLALTERLASGFMPYVGGAANGRELVDAEAQVVTAPGGAHDYAIPLHGEMYYQAQRPDRLFFHCAEAPAVPGGETLVADGVAVHAYLADGPGRELAERRIVYCRRREPAYWRALFRTGEPDAVLRYCASQGVAAAFDAAGVLTTRYADAVSRLLPDGRSAFVNNVLSFGLQALGKDRPNSWLEFEGGAPVPAEALLAAAQAAEAEARAVAWRQGDVLLIDNRRMLHGRRALGSAQRRLHLRMGMAPALSLS